MRGQEVLARYQVEVATSKNERKRGLMYRETLASTQAMLLSYRHDGVVAIWMKNTLIPLDILNLIQVKSQRTLE